MVPPDGHQVLESAKAPHDGIGARPVAHEIAHAQDGVVGAAAHRAEHGIQGFPIGMEVRQDEVSLLGQRIPPGLDALHYISRIMASTTSSTVNPSVQMRWVARPYHRFLRMNRPKRSGSLASGLRESRPMRRFTSSKLRSR